MLVREGGQQMLLSCQVVLVLPLGVLSCSCPCSWGQDPCWGMGFCHL